jgi:hypothetical protein
LTLELQKLLREETLKYALRPKRESELNNSDRKEEGETGVLK